MAKFTQDFVNFLRFEVTESAAATFTEIELDTNLSAERGVMMNIHAIEIYRSGITNLREVGANAAEQFHHQITRESKTELVDFNDSDVISRDNFVLVRSPAIGTDAGPLWFWTKERDIYEFKLPIPYVKPSIFIAVQGQHSSATYTLRGRIHYTLKTITRQEFLELLISLQ